MNEKELKKFGKEELIQFCLLRNDDAKDYAKGLTKKDAQKDLFVKKLKEELFWKNKGFTYVKPANKICGIIDKLNKEVFGDE